MSNRDFVGLVDTSDKVALVKSLISVVHDAGNTVTRDDVTEALTKVGVEADDALVTSILEEQN